MEELRQKVFTKPPSNPNNNLDKCHKYQYMENTGLTRPIQLKKEEDQSHRKVYGINSRSDIMHASRPSTGYFNPRSQADYASELERERIERQKEEQSKVLSYEAKDFPQSERAPKITKGPEIQTAGVRKEVIGKQPQEPWDPQRQKAQALNLEQHSHVTQAGRLETRAPERIGKARGAFFPREPDQVKLRAAMVEKRE